MVNVPCTRLLTGGLRIRFPFECFYKYFFPIRNISLYSKSAQLFSESTLCHRLSSHPPRLLDGVRVLCPAVGCDRLYRCIREIYNS